MTEFCRKCTTHDRPLLCSRCALQIAKELRLSLRQVHNLIDDRSRELQPALPVTSMCSSEHISTSIVVGRARLRNLSDRVAQLRSAVEGKRANVSRLRYAHISYILNLHFNRDFADFLNKKASSRASFSPVSFDEYLGNSSRFDRTLGSLHPYRKLRSVAQSLAEERKAACIKLLNMCRFRQVSIDGASQLVSEIADSTPSEVLAGMSVFLIIIMSRVLDSWLPFPLVFGTLASSPCLHSPSSDELVPYARILHSYKRVILPVIGDSTLSSHALFIENLKYMATWTGNPYLLTVPPDALQILNHIMNSSNLGREIANPLQRSFPSSPSLSSSYSPSYRRSVIEQSVTEGGEWTLLDQL